jgi:hypothetical protein
MAQLFNKSADTTGHHLKNIYESDELDEGSTTEYSLVVQKVEKRMVNQRI